MPFVWSVCWAPRLVHESAKESRAWTRVVENTQALPQLPETPGQRGGALQLEKSMCCRSPYALIEPPIPIIVL